MNAILRPIILLLLGTTHTLLAADCQVLDTFPVESNLPGNYCQERTHEVDVAGVLMPALPTTSATTSNVLGAGQSSTLV